MITKNMARQSFFHSALSRVSEWNIGWTILPFLLLYVAVCLLLANNTFVADEFRYYRFAGNLLQGFYSPPAPDIDLWSGPGYPLFLAPFLLFGFSLTGLKLLNAGLLAGSLYFCFRTARYFLPREGALLATVLLGLYYPIFRYLPYLMTECLAWFLISGITFLLVRLFREPGFSWLKVLLPALAIAFLTLTKVIFSYAVLAMILFSALALLIPGWRNPARKALAVFSLAMLFCMPYLFYTYSLTGKAFYWSNAGGLSLYTMSSPYADETGDWFGVARLVEMDNHREFVSGIEALPPLEQDEAFKQKAIENIKEHPGKYARNIVHNLGRMLFFPSSYAPPGLMSYYAFPPNVILVTFILLGLGIAVWRFRQLAPVWVFLGLFVLLYLGGSTLVSAYRRMFFITVPFWTLFLAYVFTQLIAIRWKKPDHPLDAGRQVP